VSKVSVPVAIHSPNFCRSNCIRAVRQIQIHKQNTKHTSILTFIYNAGILCNQANSRPQTATSLSLSIHPPVYPIQSNTMVSSSRPRTPSAGASSPPDKLAPGQASGAPGKNHPPRRSSLGLLLRRSKSGEFKGSKKQQAIAAAREQELQRQRDAIPKSPPRLPTLYDGAAPPKIESFGGEEYRPDSIAIATGKAGQYQSRHSMEPGRSSAATGSVPIPPIPNNGRNGDWVDPYARTESMTHRGRYSYASSAVSTINSPRRVRRRKDPTPFK